MAGVLRAGVALHQEGAEQAATELERAIELLDAADMRLYGAAARMRLGALRGGSSGDALARDAMAWMESETIRRPDRMVDMLAPGFDLEATPAR